MNESICDPLASALATFADLLGRRLERNVYTTEDSVRHTLFHALFVACNVQPDDIILEQDHGFIARARVDTWIPSFAGRSWAIEFKYDRAIPSQMNTPQIQKAGHVLKDIFRLARFGAGNTTVAVFACLTAREMARYMAGSSNGLSDLFGLKPGISLPIGEQFFVGRSKYPARRSR